MKTKLLNVPAVAELNAPDNAPDAVARLLAIAQKELDTSATHAGLINCMAITAAREQWGNDRIARDKMLKAFALAESDFEFTPSRVSISAEAWHAMKAAAALAKGGAR